MLEHRTVSPESQQTLQQEGWKGWRDDMLRKKERQINSRHQGSLCLQDAILGERYRNKSVQLKDVMRLYVGLAHPRTQIMHQ